MARVALELSDLFFNHDNENYRELLDEGSSEDEDRQALLTDAQDFCKCYPQTVEYFGSPSPEDLVADFFARL